MFLFLPQKPLVWRNAHNQDTSCENIVSISFERMYGKKPPPPSPGSTHVLPCCRPSSWPVSIQNFQSDRELKLVWSQGGEWPTDSRSTCAKWNLILLFPPLNRRRKKKWNVALINWLWRITFAFVFAKIHEWNSVQSQSNLIWELLHDYCILDWFIFTSSTGWYLFLLYDRTVLLFN